MFGDGFASLDECEGDGGEASARRVAGEGDAKQSALSTRHGDAGPCTDDHLHAVDTGLSSMRVRTPSERRILARSLT